MGLLVNKPSDVSLLLLDLRLLLLLNTHLLDYSLLGLLLLNNTVYWLLDHSSLRLNGRWWWLRWLLYWSVYLFVPIVLVRVI